MRLAPVGLAIVLLGVFFVPAAPAASQSSTCRISFKEPTSPEWSDDCTSVPGGSNNDSPALPEGEDEECHLSAIYCEPAFGAHLEGPDGEADERLNVSAEAWVGNYSYEIVVVG